MFQPKKPPGVQKKNHYGYEIHTVHSNKKNGLIAYNKQIASEDAERSRNDYQKPKPAASGDAKKNLYGHKNHTVPEGTERRRYVNIII